MNILAFDCETELIRPGLLAPEWICATAYRPNCSSFWAYTKADHNFESLIEELHRTDKIIGHNVAYDFAVLAAHDPDLLPWIFELYDQDKVEDTKIREQLIDIKKGQLRGGYTLEGYVKRGYSLAEIAQRRLGITMDKDNWRLKYGELKNIPWEQWPEGAKEYALTDAKTAYDVFLHQEVDEPGPDTYRQARAAWALHLMACWGIRTDGKAIETLRSKYGKELALLDKQLRVAGIIKPNGVKDTKKIRDLIEKELGFEAPRTEITGKISTAADTIAMCNSPELSTVSRHTSLNKIVTTYLSHMEAGVNVPINPPWNVLVTSGRTSCGGGDTKINLQNLPKFPGVRECFIPRFGNVFVTVDYSTLELRTLAQVCLWLFKKSELAKALCKGYDPHLGLASVFMRQLFETTKYLYEQGDVDVAKARQFAKISNFGYPGGMKAVTFVEYARKSYGMILTLHEATNLRASWFAMWPEMNDYFNWMSVQTQNGMGKLKQFKSDRIRGAVGFCDGCNTLFQGLAADGAKDALYEVVKACYVKPKSPLYGCRPVAFIHDEILMEAPEERAASAAEELVKIMCETMQKWVPDIPIKAEPALMRRWSKAAKTIRNEKGKLQIWEENK